MIGFCGGNEQVFGYWFAVVNGSMTAAVVIIILMDTKYITLSVPHDQLLCITPISETV